jgi:phage terminase large subunit GpA-like protein
MIATLDKHRLEHGPEDRVRIAEILREEFVFFSHQATAPKWRSMGEFTESEIVIPTGRYQDRRYTMDRQPFNRLWFEEIDSGRWHYFWATGPSQSSKTLVAFIVPVVYHLFEIGETVIIGLPDERMGTDKWDKDLKPVIAKTRYADLIPGGGKGSRGGKIESITFGNGATLRFMSAGGRDKSRAGYESRILGITEADAMGDSATTSEEANKLKQLEARMASWDQDAREYGECTVTIETGVTWQKIKEGSDSRIVLPCPRCGEWVTPERKHLRGWEEAADEMEAFEKSHWVCPACNQPWTEEERVEANRACRLIHRGQSISKAGKISGELPRTRTLGFRWSAVNNLFQQTGTIGVRLWKRERAIDEDDAEKELCQFTFATPYIPASLPTTPLDPQSIMRRVAKIPRGLFPPDADFFTGHIDLGKWLAHYMVVAWWSDGRGHIVDYSVMELKTDDLRVERATLAMLREFRDLVLAGWARSEDKPRVPDQVWVDTGWAETRDVAYAFCRESGDPFRPAVGRGDGQHYRRRYSRPTKLGKTTVFIGEEYHASRLPREQLFLMEVNADYWKSWAQERLSGPLLTEDGQRAPGSLSLFDVPPREHARVSKHFTAEVPVEEFDAKRGRNVVVWRLRRKDNHWLDTLYNCAAAGHLCGVRLTGDGVVAAGETRGKPPARQMPLTTTDGRPWFVGARTD